jgi:Zn-dependent M28 family amino/carboxypeptidase
MLETARIISQKPIHLRNSLILLFNGAEETLQDATHAFVTQHPHASHIRGFINLEAMGNKGREILFQVNSEQMLEAYQRVPRPHGSSISNDLFRTGLILSDTDYRQFVEHGGLFGVDMAVYQNAYHYHTMLDTVENIEAGVFQHMGDNTLAMLLYLLEHARIEEFEMGTDFIYFDVFGNDSAPLKFKHYS